MSQWRLCRPIHYMCSRDVLWQFQHYPEDIGIILYPVHEILLNFTREAGKKLIQQGVKIVGYPPTSFCRSESDVLTSTSVLSRRDRVLMIYKGPKAILWPLNIHTRKCMVTQTCDNVPLRIHPVLCLYVASLPEAKDLTEVLKGTKINNSFHKCLTRSQ